jgi:NAD(P)-dependent dehydrogenase (short-subunit alcohol dehydrogenase family)
MSAAPGGGAFAVRGAHAVVTGGGRGIGATIAEYLARAGANLTLMGRSEDHLVAHAAGLAKKYDVTARAVRGDVADPASIAAAFGEARKAQGDPTILVNNAGVADGVPFTAMPLAMWTRTMAVNLTGPMLCMREVLPAMLRAGAGRIVNIASTAGLRGAPRISAYSASKHGVVGLTRSVALEVAKSGVTVNAVCPGYTRSDMADLAVRNLVQSGKTEAEALAIIVRQNPQGRLIEPEEVADAVLWLCGAGASAVTGQAIVVAGGQLA